MSEKKYFCRKCGEEITHARVLFRANLCNICYEELDGE